MIHEYETKEILMENNNINNNRKKTRSLVPI